MRHSSMIRGRDIVTLNYVLCASERDNNPDNETWIILHKHVYVISNLAGNASIEIS